MEGQTCCSVCKIASSLFNPEAKVKSPAGNPCSSLTCISFLQRTRDRRQNPKQSKVGGAPDVLMDKNHATTGIEFNHYLEDKRCEIAGWKNVTTSWQKQDATRIGSNREKGVVCCTLHGLQLYYAHVRLSMIVLTSLAMPRMRIQYQGPSPTTSAIENCC